MMRTYRGVTIERTDSGGWWRAMVCVGPFYVNLAADTLDGMRQSIREELERYGLRNAR